MTIKRGRALDAELLRLGLALYMRDDDRKDPYGRSAWAARIALTPATRAASRAGSLPKDEVELSKAHLGDLAVSLRSCTNRNSWRARRKPR